MAAEQGAAGSRPEDARRRLHAVAVRSVWLRAYASYLVLLAAWLLATPISASPDEPEHVHRAAAVVRGQLIGGPSPETGRLVVTAPLGVTSPSKDQLCFAHRPDVTADCAAPLAGGPGLSAAPSEAARYNPAYYAVVGLPSLPLPSATGVYLMRLLSAALCAGLLASAVASSASWDRSRLLVHGVLVSVTPMVLFLSATVNPSPLEICAAVALWTSGLVLALSPVGTSLTPVLLRRCAVAAVALVVTRQLSPLWLALVAGILLAVAGRARLAALVQRWDCRLWALLVLVATAWATGWVLLAGSLGPGYPGTPEVSLSDGVWNSLKTLPVNARQMIGVFGWLDTPAPYLTFVVFQAALATVTVVGLAVADRRLRVALLAVLAVTVLVPALVEGSQASKYGLIWQGRYSLPLAVGIPLTAAAAAGWSGLVPAVLARRLAVVLAVLVGLGQAGAFAYALLRYQVGVSGGYDLLAGNWHPPGGSAAVLALFAVALVAHLVLLVRLAQRPLSTDAEPVAEAAAVPTGTGPTRPPRTVTTG